jgi:hypothetical protein
MTIKNPSSDQKINSNQDDSSETNYLGNPSVKTSLFFSQLLDPAHLRTHFQSNSSQRLISFYRGMIDTDSDLLEDDYLCLNVSPKYIIYEESFAVIFQMQIQNKHEDELFLLLPKISCDKDIFIKSQSIFNGVSKVPSLQTLDIELEVEVSSENLLKFAPLVVSFYACFEHELGVVFSNQNVEVGKWHKKVVLPINILNFVDNLPNPEFSKIFDLKLTQEVLVNNQNLLLTDISVMFPNLSTF